MTDISFRPKEPDDYQGFCQDVLASGLTDTRTADLVENSLSVLDMSNFNYFYERTIKILLKLLSISPFQFVLFLLFYLLVAWFIVTSATDQ